MIIMKKQKQKTETIVPGLVLIGLNNILKQIWARVLYIVCLVFIHLFIQ